MKKLFGVMLLLVLMLCTACGGKEENGSGDAAQGKAENTAKANETPVADHIVKAMAAADLLVDKDTVIIPGLGVVRAFSWDDPFEDHVEAYAKMDLKTIVVDPVTYMTEDQKIWEDEGKRYIYALTNSGDVYYGEKLIASGVERLIGSEREVFILTRDGQAFNLDQAESDGYWELGDKQTTQAASSFKGAWFADPSGKLVFSDRMGKTAEEVLSGDPSVFNQPLAMLTATEDSNGVVSLAGLTRDGKVIAAGTMSDVIGAWGELSYISGSDGVVLGLTPAGRIVTAGEVYPESITSWEGITAVKNCKGGIVALDKNGNYYMNRYNEGVGYIMFNADGFVGTMNEYIELRLYTIDGREYYIDHDHRSWVDWDGNPLVKETLQSTNAFEAVEPAAARDPMNLNRDVVLAWVDELLGDQKAAAEEMGLYCYTYFGDANGEKADQGMLTTFQFSVSKDGKAALQFINEFTMKVAQSGMLTKMTQGDIAKLAEKQAENGNYGYSLQLGNWYLNINSMPFGGYMSTFSMD